MNERNKLNPAEALYGFGGWLTSRKEPITASAAHEASSMVEAIEEFIATNELGDVSSDWPHNLKHPEPKSEQAKAPTDADLIDRAKRALLQGLEMAGRNRDASAASLASAYTMLVNVERPLVGWPALDSGAALHDVDAPTASPMPGGG